MRSAKAVVGAGWGDEAKGALTDYYSTPESVVVRFSGGANAGHTVIRDGKRHVFHHFGSGTLKGASTYLSRYFIHNPILYFQELHQLRDLGASPQVAVDKDGLVSTHFDMMLNQMVEMQRGQSRHGSCGVGINETIKRSEAGYSIVVDDLSRADFRDRLHAIRVEWVPQRLMQLGIVPDAAWQDRLDSAAIRDAYVDHCVAYHQQVTVRPLLDCGGDLLFEGAQGLLLDEDHEWFPYVTHAHTGLRNVVAMTEGLDLEVTYVTRAYATRHGPGPFPREVAGLRYADATNMPNDWQGTLRFGHLDLDLLAKSVRHDLTQAKRPVQVGLAVTCLDQIGEAATFWQHNKACRLATPEFVRQARTAVSAEFCLASDGPQATCVSSIA